MTLPLRTRATALILLLSSSPLAGGCSFAFVKGPPPVVQPPETPQCTTFPAAPLLDGAAGLAAGLATVTFWALLSSIDDIGSSSHSGFSNWGWENQVGLVGGAALSGALLASSAHGFRETGECFELRRWVSACNAGDR